jgi:hypothetical protein
MGGDFEEVDVAGADFDDEQAVWESERHRAVHVKQVRGERGRGLSAPELPPGRVGVPFRRRGDFQWPL